MTVKAISATILLGVLFENRQEVIERRLPGDDLYYPEGIN
jgi:hypothetical protein